MGVLTLKKKTMMGAAFPTFSTVRWRARAKLASTPTRWRDVIENRCCRTWEGAEVWDRDLFGATAGGGR